MPVDEPIGLNQTSRLSKWTGYEVLFGIDKKVWFVFNTGHFLIVGQVGILSDVTLVFPPKRGVNRPTQTL